jgi:ribonuclease HII
MKCSHKHERALYAQGHSCVAGLDEVGRGPLAGPVVAAAVVLPRKYRHKVLTDSKQLTAQQREVLYVELTAHTEVCWAVAIVSNEDVDR